MAGDTSTRSADAFQSLRHEAARVEDKLAAERAAAYAQAQTRNEGLLAHNATLPVTISSIQIHGARNTRHSFLSPLLQPVVESSNKADLTLGQLLSDVGGTVQKLIKLDIFHDEIQMYLARPPHLDASTSPTDLDVLLKVREKSRFYFRTGTDFGNTEGSGYASLLGRNLFGGAESLAFNASVGTRTRSAYSAEFGTPINSNPDLRLSVEGLASSTYRPWASHEEVIQGGAVKLNYLSRQSDRHQCGYSGLWRQVTGLQENASPTVRRDAGDSVKSSLSYSFTRDRRDNPILPQSGYLLRTATELAGWGSLGGDVSFSKNEMELSAAIPLPVPSTSGNSGISIGAGFRAGLLYPLPGGYGLSNARPSRLQDRFTLGGPTDVRGFTLGGLGPRDGVDAVGGDIFAAGSVNMLFPLPRVGPDSPLRFQIFANGGRSVALRGKYQDKDMPRGQGLGSGVVWDSVVTAWREMASELPSLAAGFGLIYAHPVARFELNFSLPLVLRRGEQARKGLSVGVGINFL